MNGLSPDPRWNSAVEELLDKTVAASVGRPIPELHRLAFERLRRSRAWITTTVTAVLLVMLSSVLLHGSLKAPIASAARLTPSPVITVEGIAQPYAGEIPWSDPASDSPASTQVTVQADSDRMQGSVAVCGLPHERVQVRETAESVTIAVFGYAVEQRGFCGAAGAPPQPLAVQLRQPIGSRVLVDQATQSHHPLQLPAWPALPGATATIAGTAHTTSRLIAGVGTPGGPTGSTLRALQALASRTGKLTGLPDPSRSYQVRLGAAVRSTRAAFGTAAAEVGGYEDRGFFLVLNRTPTAQEQQLLQLLPMPVRLHWGPQLTVKERDQQRSAASAVLSGAYEVSGGIDAETGTQTWEYWPNRDDPRTAQQVAEDMVAAVHRRSGAAPVFTLTVTDRSKTAEGQAALHSATRTTANDGTRLLVANRPTQVGYGVETHGPRLSINRAQCIGTGDVVLIAPPGSSISADGRTIHLAGRGDFAISPGGSSTGSDLRFTAGGADIDARTAATYLPVDADLCDAKHFLLLG